MPLVCPECNANFPKSQKNCIPYSICDWNSINRIMPPGTREDANMFCTKCDTNFIATQTTYNKLLLISYISTILFMFISISIILLFNYPKINLLYALITGGILRLLLPQILNSSVIELEKAPLKKLF